ncbi:hypothetical protein J1N35_007757, partial [Gossypium stocksii]
MVRLLEGISDSIDMDSESKQGHKEFPVSPDQEVKISLLTSGGDNLELGTEALP